MSEKAKLDITQIEEERRNTLELILVVLLLGLLLNCVASAVYDCFQARGQGRLLLWISVSASAVLLVVFAFAGLLRPARLHTEMPVVLFYDTSAGTISVPKRIHYPPSAEAGPESRIPFPILCRRYFDEYKKYTGGIDQFDLSDLSDVMLQMVQYVFINQYTKEHSTTWAPMHRVTSGPFLAGYSYDWPGQTYDRAELASRSGNRFLERHAVGFPMQLPYRSKVKFSSPGTLILYSPAYRAEIKVAMWASQPMEHWEYVRGTISSWYRELSSDFSNTCAYLFNLQIEVSLKLVFWRFFAEGWLPTRLRPKIALRDICEWVNSWISSARDFFDWVDEDVSALPDAEQAVLVDEARLAYRPQLQGASLVVFRSN